MEIVSVEKALAEKHADDVPPLVWSTGPVSYEFHFGDYALFEAFVRESWLNDGTLFAADAARFAIEGDQLLEDAMRRGREQGLEALELDVLSDNPAVRFCESMGLRLYAETRAPAAQAFGVPPKYRMAREI